MDTYPENFDRSATHRQMDVARSQWLFHRAPGLAAELVDQTAQNWRIAGEPLSSEGYARLGFQLIRDDGLAIRIHVADGKVGCDPSMPSIPDGTPNGRYPRLIEFRTEGQPPPPCTASVSARRLDTHLETVVRDFVRRVIDPYAAIYPRILAKAWQMAEMFDQRDRIAARFAKRYGVEIRGDGGSERTVFLYQVGQIAISHDGRFRFSGYSPTVSEAAMTALCDVVMAEAEAQRLAAMRSETTEEGADA